MKLILAANAPEGLDELSGWVHDLWFAASRVTWDAAEGMLTVPCGPGQPRGRFTEIPPREHPLSLVVRGVRAMTLEGDLEVDDFSINEVTYERLDPDPLIHSRQQQAAGLLRIDGVPISVRVIVDEIDVALHGDKELIVRAVERWVRGGK